MSVKKRIKAEAVIFDKDGTLMDFDAFWVPLSVDAIKDTLRKLHQGEAFLPEILAALGVYDGKTDMNSVLCKGTYEQMAQTFLSVLDGDTCTMTQRELEMYITEAYRRNVRNATVKATCANMREILLALKEPGRKLAVITTDSMQITQYCLEKLGVADLFDKIYTDDGLLPNKPKPDSALDFCETFGLNKEKVVVVGDTITDVLFARNANVKMIGVANSEKNKRFLKKETEIVVNDISELLNILE